MSDIIYPVVSVNSICPHCGKELVFIDKFGNKNNDPIYPISKFKCKDCDNEFYIKWVHIDGEEVLVPVPTSHHSIERFEKEIIEFAEKNKRNLDVERVYYL